MSEWIQLTPEGKEPIKHCRVELIGNQHSRWYEHLFARELDLGVKCAAFSLSTAELANIPWIKALIQATRKDGSHPLSTELRKLAWNVSDDERVEEINEWADKIDIALKPFEDVVYE